MERVVEVVGPGDGELVSSPSCEQNSDLLTVPPAAPICEVIGESSRKRAKNQDSISVKNLLCLIICKILVVACCCARDIEFAFTNEAGAPIPGLFYFIEYKDGRSVRSIHRGTQLDKSGKIEISDVPDDWVVGVVSADRYYYRFLPKRELPATAQIAIKVNKSAIIEVPPYKVAWPQGSLRVITQKYNERKRKYQIQSSGVSQCRGLELQGFTPGKYRFQIVTENGNKLILQSKPLTVSQTGRRYVAAWP